MIVFIQVSENLKWLYSFESIIPLSIKFFSNILCINFDIIFRNFFSNILSILFSKELRYFSCYIPTFFIFLFLPNYLYFFKNKSNFWNFIRRKKFFCIIFSLFEFCWYFVILSFPLLFVQKNFKKKVTFSSRCFYGMKDVI